MESLRAIADSLNEFKQQTPIVVSSDMIIRKGNGTYLGAKKLGWTHLDCVVTDLTGSALRAYAIADNRSGDAEIGSTWNGLVLAEELVSRATGGMPYLGPIWSQYVLYGLVLGEGLRRGRGIWAIAAILILHLVALGIIFVLVQ